MKKVLFTADWHIKLGQKGVPKPWQANRFRLMFDSLAAAYKQHECDTLIIGGDIFDKLPNMEELELYFEFLSIVTKEDINTIIYSGNHEAVKKDTTFLSNLISITSSATGGRCRIIDNYYSESNVDFIPYNKLKGYTAKDIEFSGDILCTHVRGAIPPHVVPEVPLELFDRWKLVLAGDLHSNSNSQLNIVYPGSPMTTSFHRNKVDTGYVVVDTDSLECNFFTWNMPQLLRVTITNPSEMVKTEFDHTVYELEGDLADLSVKVDSELLDKKIVAKESKSSLGLRPEMSLREELALYLKEIMQLEQDKVLRIQKIFDDSIKATNLE